MPAYNATPVTLPQQTPQVLLATPGLPTRVWNAEGFNANATPWFVQGETARGTSVVNKSFDKNITVGGAILVFVVVLSKTAVTAPAVTDTLGNAYNGFTSSTAKNQCFLFLAPDSPAGANAVNVACAGYDMRVMIAEYGGVPTSSVVDGYDANATSGYSSSVSATINTGVSNGLLVGGFFNDMGRVPNFNAPNVLRKLMAAGDSTALFDGPARATGNHTVTVGYSGGDDITLMVASLKPGTIAASPNVYSQQVILPPNDKFPRHFSVQYSFSADPGAFGIDVQTSDVDDPTQYVTRGSLTTGLNTSFAGRAEFTDVAGKFVRLVLTSMTNAVLLTADIFA